MNARILVVPGPVQRTAARPPAQPPLDPPALGVELASADVGRRLARWLADVSAEAALAPLGAPEPPEHPAPPEPIRE